MSFKSVWFCSDLSSSVGEGRDLQHAGENFRMRRLHAASETQIAVRVFQIFHNEQYVDYFRLSLATRELIPSAN